MWEREAGLKKGLFQHQQQSQQWKLTKGNTLPAGAASQGLPPAAGESYQSLRRRSPWPWRAGQYHRDDAFLLYSFPPPLRWSLFLATITITWPYCQVGLSGWDWLDYCL